MVMKLGNGDVSCRQARRARKPTLRGERNFVPVWRIPLLLTTRGRHRISDAKFCGEMINELSEPESEVLEQRLGINFRAQKRIGFFPSRPVAERWLVSRRGEGRVERIWLDWTAEPRGLWELDRSVEGNHLTLWSARMKISVDLGSRRMEAGPEGCCERNDSSGYDVAPIACARNGSGPSLNNSGKFLESNWSGDGFMSCRTGPTALEPEASGAAGAR